MGLVHTPRVIASIIKGFIKRRQIDNAASIGLGQERSHTYFGTAGLFDVDYFGHLNNAAYLSHAELARWELSTINGLLNGMMDERAIFVVAGSYIRYRREIRPIFRRFQIETSMVGIDERNIWILQNFRYPTEGRDRVRAQMLIQGVAIKDREVIDPRGFLERIGLDPELLKSLHLPDIGNPTAQDMLERFMDLEASARKAANVDDSKQGGH